MMLSPRFEDHSELGASWWIDARTGEVWLWSTDLDHDPALDPDSRADAHRIWPLESRVAYGDMAELVAGVSDRRAADELSRAIAGRGAFRRFKDALFDFPDLRTAWFQFSDIRMRRRAIEYLVDGGLVSADWGSRRAGEAGGSSGGKRLRRSAPRRPSGRRRPAGALRRPPDRGRAVQLAPARGDAHPDSDVDLAVILDQVDSVWDELRRMDGVLWRHTLESGVTVSATPFSRTVWERVRIGRSSAPPGRRANRL